jgi:hypothetical protein
MGGKVALRDALEVFINGRHKTSWYFIRWPLLWVDLSIWVG